MIGKNTNDTKKNRKMKQKSSGYDTRVTVDNFVEIGDFFDIFAPFDKKRGRKAVEKSINEFQFAQNGTHLVNPEVPGRFDGGRGGVLYCKGSGKAKSAVGKAA